MRIYIIRHGDPDYSIDSLTPKGRDEASALADYMATKNLTHLYASPMGRAQLTAQYSADKLDMPLTTLEWTRELGELYCEKKNLAIWDVDGHILRDEHYLSSPQEWERIKDVDWDVAREVMGNVAKNSDAFLAEFGYVRDGGSYQFTQRSDAQVAVYCHGGFGLMWLSHLLAVPYPIMSASFFMHPSSVTTILMDERTADRATPRCIGLSELSHLYKTGQEPSQMGIKANYA